ncbi:PilZ domain-containing protein [Bdellovibrio sp. SKB1291214]|uniref:PilZ domain-containing protein n=1 Tax=Bdellovibrio sp. SKB1291214 TaxID=1732569 RepID=UPI000B51DD35|nr:PilZ domain-containing protein [Bdellovibrio sp. SKB1291214]UYL07918.1 PilZ domain-containing protein [Bdellovibrio sp. SKB1291214]
MMKAQVFINGIHALPPQLKKDKSLKTEIVDNPYELREKMKDDTIAEKIIVAFLPFLEVRHYELYMHLQKTTPNLKIFFIVSELSSNMRIRLRADNNFIVMWKTEETNLVKNIHKYLDGKNVESRQDRREQATSKGLLSPSKLPLGNQNKGFQPILGGAFENLSQHGTCMKIQAPFYEKKDFVNLTYQNNEGEFVSLEGQVRWSKWNQDTKTQELGVHFLSSIVV